MQVAPIQLMGFYESSGHACMYVPLHGDPNLIEAITAVSMKGSESVCFGSGLWHKHGDLVLLLYRKT